MRVIIISGPSGSGKTTLSKKILKKIKGGIIFNTDNYYRTGKISRILSKLVPSYFDRNISFNFMLFKKEFNFVLKNRLSKFSYIYDYKNKKIKKINKITKNISLLIIEGIFGKEVIHKTLIKNYTLIELRTNKQSCMKRVIKRDFLERGKSKTLAQRDFIKSWKVFHNNKYNQKYFSEKIIISENYDLDFLINKIVNLEN